MLSPYRVSVFELGFLASDLHSPGMQQQLRLKTGHFIEANVIRPTPTGVYQAAFGEKQKKPGFT
ncbi:MULTISPECIES: hypothetical protein [Cyanophyceae]|uniref:hypothetical protein n=1 Tax=Cyanophyceae TaxID=3028117 RepID=UPI0016851DB5|nr:MULTISPECIES: hypothetical protein [Cyanophyceae]MBD1918012.1 hypothetical protein [Phormidium sp. FACHB-77]MBD2029260.1 hypothetical protein [Phormidium sp. FACHB-322]MBD2049792.1 hypothetical protein [Leptolyngbya sp. FACHB-60]